MAILRLISFIIFSGSGVSVYAQHALSLKEVREKYFYNNHHTCYVLKIIEAYKSKPPKDPVLIAYYGAASAAAPKCISKNIEKLRHFNKGKALLEEAVMQSPGDFEIRFLRFATQAKAPGFLGYNDNLEDDKKFLIKNLEKGMDQFKGSTYFNQILKFMIDSDELNQTEKQIVNSYF